MQKMFSMYPLDSYSKAKVYAGLQDYPEQPMIAEHSEHNDFNTEKSI